uniref:Integrase catalytic domain-containing protein n=1 Tax=Daphnia galeata TaxID=27404 RepID=A0A8J2RCG5_9CRUS|nr:unnamed protein product [Daphnia galeata]
MNLDSKQIDRADPCGWCLYCKMHRLPFPTEERERAENLGDHIHGDLGMVSVPTPEGHRYYSLLKDEFSEFTDAQLLKKKNEVSTHTIEFCEKVKTQTGRSVKVLRTDQGREYRGERFEQMETRLRDHPPDNLPIQPSTKWSKRKIQ